MQIIVVTSDIYKIEIASYRRVNKPLNGANELTQMLISESKECVLYNVETCLLFKINFQIVYLLFQRTKFNSKRCGGVSELV